MKSGVFFDVKINDDLKNKIKLIIKNQDMQEKLKMLSYEKSKRYTWYRTADLTLKFCYKVVQKNKKYKKWSIIKIN